MPKKVKGQKVHVNSEPASFRYKNDTDQEYGSITKMVGGNWLMAKCSDGHERRCHICGSLQRFKNNSTRLEVGDTILLSKRDQKTGDVILKYPSDVARKMKRQGEIVIASTDDADENDDQTEDGVEFTEEAFDFSAI
jgi:initiation factor 1A